MKGKTEVRFIGGSLDGKVEEISSRFATEELISAKGPHYVALKNERVGVFNAGDDGLHKDWFGYQVEVYKKQINSKDDITYQYVKDNMVGRCAAITKKGTRCKHIRIESAFYCPTHLDHSGDSVEAIYVI